MLAHRSDLDADFRVFYRLSPTQVEHELSGPQFLALAWRTLAYSGVMSARSAELEAGKQRRSPAAVQPAGGARTVDSTPDVVRNDPVLSQLIDYG